MLTDVVKGLNKDGKSDALSNFPLLAVQEVLMDAQIHGHLGEALEMLLDTIKKSMRSITPIRIQIRSRVEFVIDRSAGIS